MHTCITKYIGQQFEMSGEVLVARFEMWECVECGKIFYVKIKEVTNDTEQIENPKEKI